MLNDIGGLASGSPIQDTTEPHILLADFTAKLNKTALSEAEQTQLISDAGEALRIEYMAGLEALVAELERQAGLSHR